MLGTMSRLTSAVLLLNVLTSVPAVGATPPPVFSVVQPELFKPAGALTSAWGDYNNDGRLDVVITFEHGVVRLYRNDNHNKFIDVSDEVGLRQIVKNALSEKMEVR